MFDEVCKVEGTMVGKTPEVCNQIGVMERLKQRKVVFGR